MVRKRLGQVSLESVESRPRSHSDVAAPVRQILKAWAPLCVREFPSTEKGLAELAHLMLMLAIRNRAFLKAINSISVSSFESDLKTELLAFQEAHQALIANLSMLRASQVGVADVSELVPGVQLASNDFTAKRKRIHEQLDDFRREKCMQAELRAQVFSTELADEMDQAAKLIWNSIDEALESDWFGSNLPFAIAD
jgi:hypothetical protein